MRTSLLLLVASCLPLSRSEGPKAPPAPLVECGECAALFPMRGSNVLNVRARWSSTCAKLHPMPLSDTHSEDERQWSRDAFPCKRQPFRATVTCDRACDIKPYRKAAVSGEDAFFNVAPRGSGPIRITVDLRRDDTGETYHWQSDEVFAFSADDIALLCYDRRSNGYEPCAAHPLDPARPLFALALRRGDRWIPMRAAMLGRRSVEDVRREMMRDGEPFAEDGELEPYSLATLLGVDPPPPGDHTIAIQMMSMYFDRTLRVAPR